VWHECLHLNPDCDSRSNLYFSILEGVFHSNLKIAKISPLFKSGDKSLPGNYRPISVLPNLSKIFEKHVATYLYLYLSKYKLKVYDLPYQMLF
jgi:hypothetical protein